MSETRYIYNGKITDEFKATALAAFKKYKEDRQELVTRIKDNESYYMDMYNKDADSLKSKMECNTPLLFSSIENACATSAENAPTPNIIEREPMGEDAAKILSELVDIELDHSDFKKTYKNGVRNKLKYGTAIYGVFYDPLTGNIDIQNLDILDVAVDMSVEDVQESDFLFISAAVDNEVLKNTYPDYKELFVGDANIETLSDTKKLTNRSITVDCFYKKPDGTLHFIKFCEDNILCATEDLDGYENGLYDHGLYPVVFDVLYPCEHTPYGFGMIDVGKATQIQIDKMDASITENLIKSSKNRYFSKKNGGIDESEFKDLSRDIVHYDGDGESIKTVTGSPINANFITYRETKKDELKELVANRDFQQGESSGGVTSGTAISLLQQSGEKRARAMMDDSYEAFKKVIYMVIEIIRQFYVKPRMIRSTDEFGHKSFMEFTNDILTKSEYNPIEGFKRTPLSFDIDVIPQKENPYTKEAQNSMILQLWASGMANPQNLELSIIFLKNMQFDGKEKLLTAMQEFIDGKKEQSVQQPKASGGAAVSDNLVPIPLNGNNAPASPDSAEDELVPIDINSLMGGMNGVV